MARERRESASKKRMETIDSQGNSHIQKQRNSPKSYESLQQN